MSSKSLSLKDLEGHEVDPWEVAGLLEEPESFEVTFHREDIGDVVHEAIVVDFAPVAISDIRAVRELDDTEWRFFAEVHTSDASWSNVRFLFENEDGEIYDALIEQGSGIEFLHPVTIQELDR